MTRFLPLVVYGLLVLSMVTFIGCESATRSSSASDTTGGGSEQQSSTGTRVTAIKATTENTGRPFSSRNSGEAAGTGNRSTTDSMVILYGQVKDSKGAPVAGAKVSFHGALVDLNHVDSYVSKELGLSVSDSGGHYEIIVSGNSPINTPELHVVGDSIPWRKVDLINHLPSWSSNRNLGSIRVRQDIALLEGHEVTGSVVDLNGTPLPGLPVRLYPAIGSPDDARLVKTVETTSTAEGSFAAEQIPAGHWFVATAHPEFVPVMQRIQVPSSDPVLLRVGNRGGTIAGQVFDKTSGAPAGGVEVKLVDLIENMLWKDHEDFSAVSGEDGAFRFDRVSTLSKTFKVDMKDPRLVLVNPIPKDVTVAEGETTGVNLHVYPGHTVMGRVFDKDTGEALPGAKLQVGFPGSGSTAESDGEGNYRLLHVVPEKNMAGMRVTLDGYGVDSSLLRGILMYESLMLPLADDNFEVKQDVPMVKKVVLRGTVVNEADKPVPHAKVAWTKQTDESVAVDESGGFEVEVYPFTTVLLEATARGFGPALSEEIEVVAEDIDGIIIRVKPGAMVTGVVIEHSGRPVPGARVREVRQYGSGHKRFIDAALSGADGSFTVTDLPERFALYAKAGDLAASDMVELTLTPGETRGGVELIIPESFAISGRVIDSAGKPVHNAIVGAFNYLDRAPTPSVTTTEDGSFKVPSLIDDVYNIVVQKSPSYKSVRDIKAGTTDLEIVLETIPLADKKIVGLVVDDATEEPVADFTVLSTQNVRKLDEPGKFEIVLSGSGTDIEFKISAPDHLEQKFSLGMNDGAEKTFRLSRGGIITGRIVDKKSKQPVEGVRVVNFGAQSEIYVEFAQPQNHTVTDADGRFSFAPCYSGNNEIIVKPRAPYVEVTESAMVKSHETTDMGDIELSRGGSIVVRVVRGKDETPVANQQVELSAAESSGRNIRKTTGPDGRVEFNDLAAIRYSVKALNQRRIVSAQPDETVETKIVFGGVTVKGTITRAGEPVEATVLLRGPDLLFLHTETVDGKYSFSNLMSGTYQFLVTSMDRTGSHTPIDESVEVPDRKEFIKDFQLPEGRINVRVINSDGEPVSLAQVTLSKKSDNSGFDQRWLAQTAGNQSTNEEGMTTFESLGTGTYSVSAKKKGEGSAMEPAVEVRDGAPTEVTLKLSTDGGTLVSTVLSYTTGQGIQEAWCYLHGANGPFTHNAERDAAGVMTITDIPPGTYTTNVSYWSHSESEQTIEIKANETLELKDVLYPAGAILWTLTKADGSPVAGASVSVAPLETDPPEETRTGRTDVQGMFVQRGLAAGTYEVMARMEGKEPVKEVFTAVAGENIQKATATSW